MKGKHKMALSLKEHSCGRQADTYSKEKYVDISFGEQNLSQMWSFKLDSFFLWKPFITPGNGITADSLWYHHDQWFTLSI